MLELTVIPTSLNVIKALDYCDAFIVGEKGYSLRLPYYFSHEEILEIIDLCIARGQQIYIALNKIVHENQLTDIDSYLSILAKLRIDGIIFGDLSVYRLAKQKGLVAKLIYNPETYTTNYESISFYLRKGIKRVTIAKEISLKDILLIANKNRGQVELLGHGALNMFHSMRDLISNYYRFLKSENPEGYHNEELYLIEEKRDEKYPIIEDENGTHVFSGYDVCTIEYLDQFVENGVASIRIDGLFKDDSQLKAIVEIYYTALCDLKTNIGTYQAKKPDYLKMLNEIDNIRPFNEGFLFKKTIYKGEEHERNS